MSRLLILLIAVGIATTVVGCGDDNPKKQDEIKSITAPGFERTEITNEHSKNGEIYTHGDEGYYLLAENGAATEFYTEHKEHGGTYWACAAATSMESSALVRGENKITVDPSDVVKAVYDEDKSEGICPEKINIWDYGGKGWPVVEALSNGFGKYYLSAAINCEGLSKDTVKELIKTCGAMTMGINSVHNGRWFYDGYLTQYDRDNEDDHMVAVVGWDDHFPKEYFKETPSGDGAWITQDSSIDGDYVYISYDTQITNAYIFELSEGYQSIQSYEGGCRESIRTDGGTALANIFHKKGMLSAVGTYILGEGRSIDISIYDEKTGKLLHEQKASFDEPGYYTIPLEKKVEADGFRIEIEYSGAAPVEGEESFDGYLRYKASSEKNQSFIRISDSWYDMADPQTKEKLGIGFTPNNACIKAVLE
ncbi:MAG: hypothetical protein IKQ97_01200 [Eubacterium sp.]|nr:hypothetical protein [Eubacterium sp.]